MTDADIETLVRSAYEACEENDRERMEAAAAEGYTFASPDDPSLDREAYFEVCWPNSRMIAGFEIEQLLHDGEGSVLVRYLATRQDGTSFRNVEYHRVEDGLIQRTEVYYGTEVD